MSRAGVALLVAPLLAGAPALAAPVVTAANADPFFDLGYVLFNAGTLFSVSVEPSAPPPSDVPEPAALVALAAGLGGLGAARRRRAGADCFT